MSRAREAKRQRRIQIGYVRHAEYVGDGKIIMGVDLASDAPDADLSSVVAAKLDETGLHLLTPNQLHFGAERDPKTGKFTIFLPVISPVEFRRKQKALERSRRNQPGKKWK